MSPSQTRSMVFTGLLGLLGTSVSPIEAEPLNHGGSTVSQTNIVMDVEGKSVTVALDDSAATRDFLAQLPITLTFDDYHGIEKVSDLPEKLSVEGAPAGFDPEKGSFTYYAPWGNLAIFYRDFGYSRSLVNLGTVTSGLEHLTASQSFTATIRVVD